MSLISLIQQHALAEAQAEQWAEAAEILNAATVAVRNPKQWTIGEVEQTLGADAARLLVGAVKSAAASDPLLESAFVALSTTGVQFHTDSRQQMIAAVGAAAGFTAEQIAAMQSLGRRTVRYVDSAGLGTVTADQCRTAWLADRLQARIINATALMHERLTISQTAEQQAAVVATAWLEAV